MRRFILLLLLVALVYTRFVNIGWGLPYPMHPDERNMASAVQQLSCTSFSPLATCFNPHFFAYGQFPLYLAYAGIQIYHVLIGLTGQPTFNEAVLSLRVISGISSLLLVFVLYRMRALIQGKKQSYTARIIALLIFIFSPYAIQFDHFVTSESFLLLLYMIIIHLSIRLAKNGDRPIPTKYILCLATVSGLSLGTKISSLLFLGVPIAVLCIKLTRNIIGKKGKKTIYHAFLSLFLFSTVTLLFFVLSSPHTILNWNDFISSMTYESRVGLGRFVAFYTRQFEQTPPLFFQATKILPYVLGWPILILSLGGFLLPTRLKRWEMTILRYALLLTFMPSSFFFAKWTRFISPSFPLFTLFAVLFIDKLFETYGKNTFVRVGVIAACCLSIVPGIAFLSIYTTPDVRFTASEWMYKNIPSNSKILSETANAIDLPIPTSHTIKMVPNYLINSFNFYDLDQDVELQKNLSEAVVQADYVIVPSRRIFYNHTCFVSDTTGITTSHTERCRNNETLYPLLTRYYDDLFHGRNGFQKIAEFNSFPRISFMGKVLWESPDEQAEETWSVFDHPVVRIYKKMQGTLPSLSTYQTTTIKIMGINHKLLIADTPEKWEKGLMYVRNKDGIGGSEGMVFIFPDSQQREFWNKNTVSNLQLYWINKRKILGNSFLPSIETSKHIVTVSSPGNADQVIELIQ